MRSLEYNIKYLTWKNFSENCLDRHLEKLGDQAAIIWEKDEPGQHEVVTYRYHEGFFSQNCPETPFYFKLIFVYTVYPRQLHEMTCRVANVMYAHGITKGDIVGVYMPNSPLSAAVMLACARIGE